MADPFDIIKDSSIWKNPTNYAALDRKDPYLRLGIVQRVFQDTSTTEIRYLVDMRDTNDNVPMNCRMLRHFGGVYNYEDVVYQGYTVSDSNDPVTSFDAKAGDVVLVAMLNGQGREAIIIGGLTHPARTSIVDVTQGPQYRNEFNGVLTTIDQNGQYTVTFRGLPTNVAALDDVPSQRIADPTYDMKVGTSFFMMDVTGGLTLSDNATDGSQFLKIDKAGGIVSLAAGDVLLQFTKSSQEVDLTCKVFNLNAATSISETTGTYTLKATTSTTINSPTVAIGANGVELLNELSLLIDALGTLTPISPVGPCTPLNTTATWPQVQQIQAKIDQITGSL